MMTLSRRGRVVAHPGGLSVPFFCGSSFFAGSRSVEAATFRQRGTCVQDQASVGTNMDSLLRENRVFPPATKFAAKAHIKSLEQYEAMYRRSIDDPAAFWAEAAGELGGVAPWTEAQDHAISPAKWRTGGQ